MDEKSFRQNSGICWDQGHQVFRLADHAFGDGYRVFLQHTAAQQLICLVASSLRDGMVRFVKVNWADVLEVSKVQNVNRPVFLCLLLFKIIIGERDIPSRLDLEAFYDPISGNLLLLYICPMCVAASHRRGTSHCLSCIMEALWPDVVL